MKWFKKWSFLTIWLLCGALLLSTTDSWAAVEKPARQTGLWLSQLHIKHTVSGETPVGKAGRKDHSDKTLTVPQDMTDTAAEEPDPTQPAETSEAVYTAVGDDYFTDAVFIGDSRIVGFYEYSGLENTASFYASTGLTIYRLFDKPIISVPGQREKITVEQALTENRFGKIYLMIGINEMGTGTLEGFLAKYAEAVNHLRELQPDAMIYLQSIMKVTAGRSAQGDYINNEGIDARNEGIKALANDQDIFYLDVNPLICDESGGMNPDYTYDGVHLKAAYIPIWKGFLQEHAVLQDET